MRQWSPKHLKHALSLTTGCVKLSDWYARKLDSETALHSREREIKGKTRSVTFFSEENFYGSLAVRCFDLELI